MAKLTDRLNSFIGGVKEAKHEAEDKLQGIGRRIRRNVEQGQADLKSGKVGRNQYINPLKK